MVIPTEIRYRAYEDWSQEEKKKIQDNVISSPWRTNYHLEPKTGLLNDPNGFSFFDGKFQLFYQNWPFGAGHGLKSWVHTESEDLVHFNETGVIIFPDTPLDSHGAYSGSAYEVDGKLFIFYTGNVRDEAWVRSAFQIGALMDTNVNIEKMDDILIEAPKDVTDHFRDPQIFEFENQFYAIIGAQGSVDEKGFIKLYKAVDNDITKWEFVNDLNFGGKRSEYMIECPNLVFVDGKPVLLYCPQGLSKDELNYGNIYPNTFKIFDSFDPKTATLSGGTDIINLDYGFECYATQGFNAPDGRVLIVSWIGLPDIEYPTDKFDHQGAMSLVKELSIKDGKLYQYPVEAMSTLRSNAEEFTNKDKTANCYELELTFAANQENELKVWADENGKGLSIKVDTKNGKVIIDRGNVGEQYALDYGTTRECDIEAGQEITANIFIDNSVFEIFFNKGEKVFTGRVFPLRGQSGIKVESGEISGSYYELNY